MFLFLYLLLFRSFHFLIIIPSPNLGHHFIIITYMSLFKILFATKYEYISINYEVMYSGAYIL